ncbi:RrF2 family transcriptional regulator [Hyphomicrobium sp.]|mgnify:CR=1 FL=1|uniref:RrF2 family transcriptional regulator n=1 Tax=Hyphomicrobium sp. TaxID=82 RepID=UPI002FE290C6
MRVVSRAIVAVRLLHYVATCPGGVAKKNAIAKAIGAPAPYTGKIAHELLLAGFIKSVRGSRGGYTLALPATSIRVGDVVQFVEDTRSWRVGSNPDDIGMRDAFKAASDRFFDVLNAHSIAELCAYTNRGKPADTSTVSSRAPAREATAKSERPKTFQSV